MLFALLGALFLIKLDFHYFFTDEILYVQRGVEQLEGTFEDTLQVHPLPKYIAGTLFLLFGNNVLFLRMPYAVIGMITAYILYLIIKREFGRGFAALAVVIYATSRIIFDSTRMVMLEPLMHLFWLAFHYFYYQIFFDNRRKLYIISGIFLGLSLSAKLTSIIVLPFVVIGLLFKLWKNHSPVKSLLVNYLYMFGFSVLTVFIGYIHMFLSKGIEGSVFDTAKAIKDVYLNKSSEGKLHAVNGTLYEKSPWWTYFFYHLNVNGLLRSLLYPILLVTALVKRNFFVAYWLLFVVLNFVFHQLSGVKNLRYVSSLELSLIPLLIVGLVNVLTILKPRMAVIVGVSLAFLLSVNICLYLVRLKPTKYLGLYNYFKAETYNFNEYQRIYVFGSVRSMKWYRDMVPDKNMFIYRRDYELMCPEFGSFDYFAFDREELLKDNDNLLYRYVQSNKESFGIVSEVRDMDVYKKIGSIDSVFDCAVSD